MKFKSFLGKRLAPIVFILALVISMIPVQAFAKVGYDPKEDYKELPLRFWEDQQPDVGFYINASSRYILETVTAPQMGSTFGEWSVMDLLRGMYTGYDYLNYIPENYFEDYLQRINGYVIGKEGVLDRNKSTEWARLTLALSSLGYDITSVGTPGSYFKTYYTKNTGIINAVKIEDGNVINLDTPVKIYASIKKYIEIPAGTYTLDADANTITDSNGEVNNLAASQFLTIEDGYDFISKLSESFKFSYKQGINGPIWEIIAMNTGGYKFIEDETNADNNTFGKMIGYILKQEITQTDGTVGGWALTGKVPDPDITGMALQALAPYYLDRSKYEAENVFYEDTKTKEKITYSYEDFAQAVERAVLALSTIQQDNAGYGSWGSDNSESIVQVIAALTALGIDPLQENIELPHIGKTTDFITEGAERDGVITNNMIDALLAFWAEGSGSSPEVGGFKHVKSGNDGGGGSGTTVNAMATDQALYGLIAYDRFKKGENSLYDMTDMTSGQYKDMKAKTYTINYVGNTTSNIKTETYSPYAVIELPDNNESVNLKTFSGWNTKEDGSGVNYEAGELLSMPEQDITLYAQYEYSTDKIIEAINALPKIEDFKLVQKSTVDQVRKAYDELTEQEKDLVSNYQTLVDLEKRIQELKAIPLKLQLNNVSDKDKTVTGQTEAESKVEVKVNDSVIGSGTADQDGNFKITIKVQKAGTTISVYTTDLSGERKATTTVNVVDKTAPSVPTVNTVSDKSTTITGKAETNAKVYAKVGSKIIGETTAKNGAYTINISKQIAGTTITVYAVDAAKNQSANKTVKVVDKTAPTVPTVNVVSDKSTTITGKAETNAKVYAKVGSKIIGEATAKNGSYTIKISKQKAGTTIAVYALDAAKNQSGNKTVKVVDKTAPSVPTVNTVSDKSTTITGKAEKNAKVYAMVGSKKIGEATAKNGTYTIKIKKQKAGTTITVYAVDAAKNKSGNKKVKVVDKTAPSVPTVNKVTSKSVTVSGKGEKGATIYIYNGSKKIGQGTVNSKGNYKVKIKKQKKGSTIKVYAKDKAGNKSKNKTIKVK